MIKEGGFLIINLLIEGGIEMEVGILFSNEKIFALNKPAGLITSGPQNGDIELWEIIKFYHRDADVVHRIDKQTSGIVLSGKNPRVCAYFFKNWHSITKKIYLAVIRNPSWDTIVVDTPVAGKTATTTFHVLERGPEFSLVRCELTKNGRTHQIRVHLKSIGCPVAGDRVYKGPWNKIRKGQLLHAWQIAVRLPDDNYQPGKWVSFQAPIPEDFKEFSFDWERWDFGKTIPVGKLKLPPHCSNLNIG